MSRPMLKQIRDLSVRLSSAREEHEIFDACLDTIQSALGTPRASLLLFDERDVMSFVAWRGLSDEYRRTVRGHTPWSPDSPSARPLFSPDVFEDESLAQYRGLFVSEGIRSLGFFPLVYRNRVLGKFMVYSDTPRTFSDEETAAGEVIAAEVGFGLARLRAEKAAAELTLRLEVLLASAPAIIWETEGRAGKTQQLVYVSEQIEALLGYPLDRWYAEPNFWREVIVNTASFASEGLAIDPEKPVVGQAVMRRADGTHVWTEVRTSVVTDADGNPAGVRGVTVDISERKREEQRRLQLLADAQEAQERAERAEARANFLARFSDQISATLEFNSTLRHAMDLITREVADWCVIDVAEESGARRAIATTARPDGAPPFQFVSEIPPVPLESLSSEPVRIDEMPRDLQRWLESTPGAPGLRLTSLSRAFCVPVISGGRQLGTLLIASGEVKHPFRESDLTFVREIGTRLGNAIFNAQLYRDLTIASRTKDEFLATLSHELRTPLTSIIGWASMMREGLSPEQHDLAIDTIHRSATLQRALVDDILDVSRITRGKLSLNPIPLDFAAIVRSCVNTMHPMAQEKGVRLEPRIRLETAPMKADAERLEQVVTNLLTNAIKFTPRGGTIELDLSRTSEGALIEIRDDGIGIEAEFLPDIFDPFRQADASSTRQHQGLGLGLSLVRSIVEMHQGRVEADSDGAGKGATFRVILPLHQIQIAQETSRSGNRLDQRADTRVLLIEDDLQTRELLATILRHANLDVHCSSNADEAMRALVDFNPHVVLTDVGLPGASGVDLLGRVRKAGCTAPAVALTGYAGCEQEQAILEAGFTRHLLKPVEPEALLNTIAAVVDAHA